MPIFIDDAAYADARLLLLLRIFAMLVTDFRLMPITLLLSFAMMPAMLRYIIRRLRTE